MLKLFDRLEQIFALIMLCCMVLAVLVAGIGRSLGSPVMSAPQFAQLFLIWTCVLGADLSMKQGGHIRVSAITDMLPDRVRGVLVIISLVLMFAFLGFVIYHGWYLAVGNWQRELGASGLSYGLVTLAVPVGALLITISLIRRCWTAGILNAIEPDRQTPEAAKEIL